MTLQASGQITSDDILAELGETGLADFNSASFRDLAGIPTGEIDSTDFYGKSNISQVLMSNASVSSSRYAISPVNAIAEITMTTNGQLNITSGLGANQTWSDINAVAGNYEYRFTGSIGDLPTSYATAWTSFSVDIFFSIIESINGFASKSFSGTLEIREIANTSNIGTISMSLFADVEV